MKKVNRNKLKGVNLGGWLVLEKWITPSLFAGTEAEDEYNLLKSGKKSKILKHYDSFIKEEDFEFLSKAGVNSFRIPVGYWLFGNSRPYLKTVQYLDFAFEMAEKYGLKVLIDLHGAPGSQNGYNHSGRAGEIGWDKNENNILKTLDVITEIANRYGQKESLFGIELLNEPHQTISLDLLMDFYDRGYKIIREICGDKVAVIISDSFRPYEIIDYIKERNFHNVILDSHFYQCFSEDFIKMRSQDFFRKAKKDWSNLIKSTQKYLPIISGEWSLGLKTIDFKTLLLVNNLDTYSKNVYIKYLILQKDIYRKALGSFFWSYKIEGESYWVWDFRKLVENGFFSSFSK